MDLVQQKKYTGLHTQHLPLYHSPDFHACVSQSTLPVDFYGQQSCWGVQEEWRRMGFRGEFQGTGQLQDALQQHDHTMQASDAVRGMPRGRC